jgi:hypothetical protein
MQIIVSPDCPSTEAETKGLRWATDRKTGKVLHPLRPSMQSRMIPAARWSFAASSALARRPISSGVKNRSRSFSIRRRNAAAGLSSRQPQPTASVNILHSTSPTRFARTGVGFGPCSLRARLFGLAFDGRARPAAILFNSFSTSYLVISVTSFLPQWRSALNLDTDEMLQRVSVQ